MAKSVSPKKILPCRKLPIPSSSCGSDPLDNSQGACRVAGSVFRFFECQEFLRYTIALIFTYNGTILFNNSYAGSETKGVREDKAQVLQPWPFLTLCRGSCKRAQHQSPPPPFEVFMALCPPQCRQNRAAITGARLRIQSEAARPRTGILYASKKSRSNPRSH